MHTEIWETFPTVKKIIQSIGRRKSALAKATLSPGKGIIRINNQLLSTFMPSLSRQRILEPLLIAEETASQVDIKVTISGGGIQGQADAARVAIARALSEFNKKLKKSFLDYDRQLIVQDTRHKEQRKPNDSKARSSRQKSYR